jgi:predicted ATPase
MLLRKIELENILSFKKAELDLCPLNVLIGANGSGKSNLIRVLGLVKALPKDMSAEIANGGGPRGWINQRTKGTASIKVHCSEMAPVSEYHLAFRESGQAYEIAREDADTFLHREFDKVRMLSTETPGAFSLHMSVLSELRYPGPITELAKIFESIRLYREFKAGPGTQARTGIAASVPGGYLFEDGGNLALFLGKANRQRSGLKEVSKHLHRFFEPFEEVRVHTEGGVTQLYVLEEGVSEAFAAISLSDGTLRLLCLLAILLDPTPPPLVCIEEPEAGLHPDAIRMIADLLVEASTRTQLIITTHSPELVDALSSQPESVVVCERDFDGFTQFRRLKSADLDEWLERYTLGQLWQKGEIGGNRW